jgi:Phospholipase_D-nuclease N-terminal
MQAGLLLGFGYWAAGLTIAGVFAFVIGVAAIASLLRNTELSGGTKAMWALIIVFFPIFGSAIYFTVRNDW